MRVKAPRSFVAAGIHPFVTLVFQKSVEGKSSYRSLPARSTRSPSSASAIEV